MNLEILPEWFKELFLTDSTVNRTVYWAKCEGKTNEEMLLESVRLLAAERDMLKKHVMETAKQSQSFLVSGRDLK